MVVLSRRARANWRLLSVLFAGVLLATTLLAGAPLYLGAMKELGLRHALDRETTGVLDTAVGVQYRPLDPVGYGNVRDAIEGPVEAGIGSLVIMTVAHVETPPLGMQLPPGAGTRGTPPKGSLQSFTGYEDHSLLVAGAFPRPGAERGKTGPIVQVAIGRRSAQAFNLHVGDEIALSQAPGDSARTVFGRVSGIVDARDRDDQYWTFVVDPFVPQVSSEGSSQVPLLPILVPHDTFFQDLPPALRGTLVSYWWYFYIDPSRINAGNVDEVRKNIQGLESTLGIAVPGANVFSGLTRTLQSFDQKLFFSRIPILVMLILVITLVLYYLVMVANVVVDQQLAEIALLRSRGANTTQVLMMFFWDAALICGAAFLLGPLLGLTVVPLLGKAPAFQAATAGQLLPVRLTAATFLFSLAGALLAFFALLAPAVRGARFNLLSVKAAAGRPATVAFFHRYFLDFFLLALAGLLWWELTRQGSLVTRKLFGGDSTDYLLLIEPALFMLGTALVLLRLLPVVIRVLAVIASYSGRTWLVMGLWAMGRNPVHHLRLILLLTLVAGLAMFASSFNATVEKSFRDRGLYQSGSDARLVNLPSYLGSNTRDLAGELEKEPEVRQATAAYRLDPKGFASVGEGTYPVLAIDTINFNRVAWFRDDFSEHSLFSLLRQLDRGRSIVRGVELPRGTSGIGVWIKPAKAYPNVSLWVRLRDADGRHWRLKADRLDFDEWRFLGMSLAAPGLPALPQPVALESLFLWEFDYPKESFSMDLLMAGYVSSAQINLSGLMAFTPGAPQGTLIDPLRDPNRWQPMAISALAPETLKASRDVLRDGQQTTEFSWQSAPGLGIRGIFPSDAKDPLPIVVDAQFLSSTGRKVGDTMDIPIAGVPVPVKIADTVSFFPTLDPRQPFVLANMDSVLYYVNLFRGANEATPNEVWISLVDNKEERNAFLGRLKASEYGPYLQLDRDEELEQLANDPLVGTGSRTIVFTTFLVLIVVGIGGYLGYMYVSSSRVPMELAVLKSLGLTGRQLAALQLLIHGVIVLVAAVLGAWVGSQAHGIMIMFLQHTERGRQILPPLAPYTSWTGLGAMLAMSGLIVAIVLGWLVWTFIRVPIWKVLRGGGE